MRRIVAIGLLILSIVPTLAFDLIHTVGVIGNRVMGNINDRIAEWGEQ